MKNYFENPLMIPITMLITAVIIFVAPFFIFEVITGLVENGVGISVLPYMDIIRHHNIVAIPVQTSIWKSKFYIARRKYGIRSDQEEAFFQYWRKNRL